MCTHPEIDCWNLLDAVIAYFCVLKKSWYRDKHRDIINSAGPSDLMGDSPLF